MIPLSQALQLFTTPRRIAAGEEELRLLAAARRHTLALDDLALPVWQWGDVGPKVVLAHGWDSRASHLGGFVLPLLTAGFQVWAYDGPAHGDAAGEVSSVRHLARALLAMHQVHGPFAGVITHSAGSAAALYAFAQGMTVQASVHISGPTSLRRLIHNFVGTVGLRQEQADAFNQLLEQFAGAPLNDLELHNVQHGLRHAGLLLHDPADPEVPYAESAALHAVWPQSQLIAVPEAGHRRIIRTPSVIEMALRHLSAALPNSLNAMPAKA